MDISFKTNAAIDLDDLTLESSPEKILLYGSIDITRDKLGYSKLKQLLSILNPILTDMEQTMLPEKLEFEEPIKMSTYISTGKLPEP